MIQRKVMKKSIQILLIIMNNWGQGKIRNIHFFIIMEK